MRTRPCWLILAILLASTTARADDHKADWDAGFGGANGSSIWGVHLGASWTPPKPEHHNISLVADGSFLWGSENEEDAHSIFGGVRCYFPTPIDPKVLFFAQVLVGYNHLSHKSDPGRLAYMAGAGFDVIPNRRAMSEDKKGGGGDGIRFQFDVLLRDDARRLIRVSVGYVHRFDR